MTRAVVVRYRTRPDAAEENERLVEAVYAELAATRPAGFRYSTVRLDETTFVHTALSDSEANPLNELAAFRTFVAGIADRCEEPPVATEGRVVGRYP